MTYHSLRRGFVSCTASLFLALGCSADDGPQNPGSGGSGPASGATSSGSGGNVSGGGERSGGTSGGGASSSGGASGASGGNGGEGGGAGAAPATGGRDPGRYSTLREAAADAGVLIGSAVSASALSGDATYAEILAREFDYVTPENAAKWEPLAPSSSAYVWGDTDAMVDFAEEHDQEFKWHTHVWHRQYPGWIESLGADELRAAIKSHIEATLDRYSGRIRSWDVVNEAIDVAGPNCYTDSVFYQVLGESYIADAFRWAREADPNVELIYNEVGIERMGAKSDCAYEMIQGLLADGVPIDGIGFQSHVSTHRYPSEFDLRENIRRFAALGLKVNISEIDARVRLMPGDQASQFEAERLAFQQIVASCVVEPGCDAISFWGFTDAYSWINDEGPEDPLLFDRNYTKKPAYEGALWGLAGILPARGENLVQNADFAAGDQGWSTTGGTLTVGPSPDRDGSAGCVSARSAATEGLLQEGLLHAVGEGGPMSFSAQVRLSAPGPVDGVLLIESADGTREFNVATRPLDAGIWTRVSGYLGLGYEENPTGVSLLINGPDAGVDVCVTDVELQKLSAR